MATIDTVTDLIFLDHLTQAPIAYTLHSRSGVAGMGVALDARRIPPQRMRTVHRVQIFVDAAAAIEVTTDAYRALEGVAVEITDQFGRVWDDVLVLAARVTAAAIEVEGTHVLIDAEWQLLVQATEPA